MRGEDAYKEDYEHIELFGEPGLFTNSRIDRETVPTGWYCYDLRGSDDDPGDPTTVEEQVTSNHAGTVLLPKALKLNRVDFDGTHYRKIGEGLNFLDGEVTLEEFCKEHGLAFPERNPKYELKPMSADEFKRLGSDDETTIPYAIGYVRIDFGRNGKEFWHTWWPKNEDKFNTPVFKTELQEFINDLRAVGPLRDRRAMGKYCSEHMAGKQSTSLGDMYAYSAETERYRFGMRFDPRPGMYNCYLYAYDLNEQRRLEQGQHILKGERELRPEDIRFGGDIEEMNEHQLNFYMETWFNVDEVFGTNVCTDENEDYLNVYANYDMSHNRLCDTLSIVYWKGDECEEYEYRLSEAEKKMILPKMDAYCKERTEMSLSDYSAMRIAEDQEITPARPEQPKKPAVKKTAGGAVSMSYTKEAVSEIKTNQKQIEAFSVSGDSKEARQSDFIKIESLLHRYKMEALENALRESCISVDEALQNYLLKLYSENVPFPVQQEIKRKIKEDYEKQAQPSNASIPVETGKAHKRGDCR